MINFKRLKFMNLILFSFKNILFQNKIGSDSRRCLFLNVLESHVRFVCKKNPKNPKQLKPLNLLTKIHSKLSKELKFRNFINVKL